MALTDVGVQPNITIKVEEDQEVSDVKGCFIWLSENTQPNFLDETGGGRGVPRVKRRRCSVANCRNFLYKNNPSSEPRLITFHKFPKDERTRAIWVELCNRSDTFSAKSSFICSVHFKPEDYVKHCFVEHPLERKAHRLKPGAIPCLELPEIRLNGSSLLKKMNNKITQNVERKLSLEDEEDDDSDFTTLQSSDRNEHNPSRNEEDLMESSQEEEGGSGSTTPHSSSRNEKHPNHPLDSSSEVVTINSSDDDYIDDVETAEEANKHHKEKRKQRLDSIKLKYDHLQCSFEKLKTETNEEIERLNGIIKNKEDEFSRELREVLSVFLKPEEVESVVEQTVW